MVSPRPTLSHRCALRIASASALLAGAALVLLAAFSSCRSTQLKPAAPPVPAPAAPAAKVEIPPPPAAEQGPPMIPDLPWEKRSDWIDVKTGVTPAAKGDGLADDTDALQAAFKLMNWNSKIKTIHLPAGTYRITRPLELGGTQNQGGIVGGAIIGNGRSTKIVWDGEEKGAMIKSLGFTHSSFTGFVLDGRGKAAVGVLHVSSLFETDMLYRHVAFMNLSGAGICIGDPHDGQQTAELLYDNCLFDHCGIGVTFHQFNDYDNAFNGCEFRNCGIGVHNIHGNAYIRDCHFERSSNCDFYSAGEHASSVRRCTSIGSRRFIDGGDPVARLMVQDCQVEGWTDDNPADPAQTWSACHVSQGSVFMDCTFSGPKGRPFVFHPYCRKVFVSNVKTSEGVRLFNPVHSACTAVELPPGEQGGMLNAAKNSFLKTSVPMPGKLFDAKPTSARRATATLTTRRRSKRPLTPPGTKAVTLWPICRRESIGLARPWSLAARTTGWVAVASIPASPGAGRPAGPSCTSWTPTT